MSSKDDVYQEYSRFASELMTQLIAAEKAELFVNLAYDLHLEHLLHPDARFDLENAAHLPNEAPELYRERKDRSEKPGDFILRVYDQWLGNGLARPHLMALDRPLYDALHNWLRKNPLPDNLILPTKKEMIDAELNKAGLEDGEQLPFPSDSTILQKRRRLYNASRNRAKKE